MSVISGRAITKETSSGVLSRSLVTCHYAERPPGPTKSNLHPLHRAARRLSQNAIANLQLNINVNSFAFPRGLIRS